MAYRKLLTKRTYDELKSLRITCETFNKEEELFEVTLFPCITLDDDGNVFYATLVLNSSDKLVEALKSKTHDEMQTIISAYTLGFKLNK